MPVEVKHDNLRITTRRTFEDPEKKIGDGRQLKEKWKDENRNQDHDPRVRKEEEVNQVACAFPWRHWLPPRRRL